MTTDAGTAQGEPTPTGDGKPPAAPAGAPTPQADKPPTPPAGKSTNNADDGTDWQAEAKKWRSTAQKDAKAKETADAQLKAIQDMLTGKDAQTTEAERRAAAAELEASKYRIAYEAGLPPDLAVRLAGSTEAELKADAEGLAKYAQAGKKPKSDARADDNGASAPNTDKNAMLRQIVTGR